MISYSNKIRINKPADVVYKAFVDPDNTVKWQTELVGFEPLKGKYAEAGSIARLHFQQGKKHYTMEERVEYTEPGKKIVSLIYGAGLEANVEVTFEADHWETDLAMTWNGKAKGILSAISMRFSEQKIMLRLEKELNNFKELVETYGIKFK